VVADVTRGLDFADVEAIFAEHFLEHLALDEALAFLVECHRVLRRDGVLRLSTPNLEWVWRTHYPPDLSAPDRRRAALCANLAFHGWGHRFLWNREMLAAALGACGFVDLAWCRYGESPRPALRGLEQHERSADTEGAPHVLIAEAVRGQPRPDELAALRTLIRREFLRHLDG
jgi:hypothetical protein